MVYLYRSEDHEYGITRGLNKLNPIPYGNNLVAFI